MIINFLSNQFNRFNIDNKKTRVFIPLFFIAYMVILFCLSVLLKKIFPFEAENQTSIIDKELNLLSITIFLIFAAIMEELKYRGLLTKYSFRWILISLSVLSTSIFFLVFDIKVYYLYSESLLELFKYILKFSFLSIFIYLILFSLLSKHKEQIRIVFNNNFNLILIAEVVLFSVWHILFSGQDGEKHYLNLFIFHSTAALFLTFIRINYGILYAIILHFLHNFLVNIAPIILVRLLS